MLGWQQKCSYTGREMKSYHRYVLHSLIFRSILILEVMSMLLTMMIIAERI